MSPIDTVFSSNQFGYRKIYILSKTHLTMEFEITRLSSKGQIVIPLGLRKGFNEGDKLIMVRKGSKIVMSKASEIDKKLKEDLEVAKQVEEAWKEIEEGKGKTYTVEEFKKHLRNDFPKNL